MNRRAVRWVSFVGDAAIVFGLSKIHAAFVANPPYDFTGSSRFGWALAFVGVLALAGYGAGLPEQPRSTTSAIGLAMVAATVAAIAMSVVQLAVGDALLPRFVVFVTCAVTVPWQVCTNLLIRRLERSQLGERVLLIATTEERSQLDHALAFDPDARAFVVTAIDPGEVGEIDRSLGRLFDQHAANLVVVDRAAMTDDRIVSQVASLHESGVRVRTLLSFYEERLAKLPASELERASLLFDIGEVHNVTYLRIKRGVDLMLGTAGVLAVVLITPFVAAGNAFANRGPLIYRQARVGKGGEQFTIFKFRTMTAEEPSPEGGTKTPWTSDDDPRVTPFGRFLRRTHLDELPQAINVLRGDLSVVGPRPEQPSYVEELREKLPFYDLRHLVRPGMTGWAQIKYGYAGSEQDALEKLQYEFFYLRHQSTQFDLSIMVRTLGSLSGGAGAGR